MDPQPRRRPARGRARPGSLERPINARSVRGTLLLVALPLLLAAFTMARPAPLPPPTLPPLFDGQSASDLAVELARDYPDRTPGSANAIGAAGWFTRQFALYGFRIQADVWREDVPGLGDVELRNLSAVVPGRTPEAIVVMAHRDTTGDGPGARDNASGTAALVELAKSYARPDSDAVRARPTHTIVFVSTDGGAFGSLGAARFLERSPHRGRILAVLSLDTPASDRPSRLEISADAPRSPAAALVTTAAERVLEQSGARPAHAGALDQLFQLGFPVAYGEQAPFVATGVPAVTLTTGDGPARPEPAVDDAVERLTEPAAVDRLGDLGRAAQALVGSLDTGLEIPQGTTSYLYLGDRIVRGWTVELVLVCLLAPFLVGAVDLFARLRRRRVPLLPAVRSLRSRLGFWAFVGLALAVLTLAGLFPGDPDRPLAVNTAAAREWPVAGLVVLSALAAAAWLIARVRLLPRRPVGAEERLAGYAVGLLALALLALTTVAVNTYALVFLLPALYAWLWLPQFAASPAWVRVVLFLLGLAGPLLGLVSLARRTGLGLDVLPYTLRLFTAGYASIVGLVFLLAGAAIAGQFAALAAGRYAPYPDARERPPRGPIRALARRAHLARRRRLAADAEDAAAAGPG
jgi:Peptidase family M28